MASPLRAVVSIQSGSQVFCLTIPSGQLWRVRRLAVLAFKGLESLKVVPYRKINFETRHWDLVTFLRIRAVADHPQILT